MAYPLYAWLLSHVPKEEGDALHEQGIRPISQYVYREGERVQWVVNLLNEEAATFFEPILERADAALLHQGVIPFGEHQVEKIDSVQTLMNRAGERNDENRFALELVTPTAFKQNGRYAVFPQESLVLQSLIARWGLCFPEFPLDDPDAVQAMLAGLHIVDYRLHTVRYSMKQTKIPSFLGRIILEAHLPGAAAGNVQNAVCVCTVCRNRHQKRAGHGRRENRMKAGKQKGRSACQAAGRAETEQGIARLESSGRY